MEGTWGQSAACIVAREPRRTSIWGRTIRTKTCMHTKGSSTCSACAHTGARHCKMPKAMHGGVKRGTGERLTALAECRTGMAVAGLASLRVSQMKWAREGCMVDMEELPGPGWNTPHGHSIAGAAAGSRRIPRERLAQEYARSLQVSVGLLPRSDSCPARSGKKRKRLSSRPCQMKPNGQSAQQG